MCRGNDHGARRCPASTNPVVRKKQNHAYYLKRKTAGTVGMKLTTGSTLGVKTSEVSNVQPVSAYRNIPHIHDIGFFLENDVEGKCYVNLDLAGKPVGDTNTDEVFEKAKGYAKRLGAGFSTEFTTRDGKEIICEAGSVEFKNDGGSKGRVFIKGDINVDGKYAGEWQRIIMFNYYDEPAIEYEKLELEDEYHEQKIGTQLIAHFDKATKSTGISLVKTYANSDIGGYAWAKAGYDWDLTAISDGRLPSQQLLRDNLSYWDVDTDSADGGAAEQKAITLMRTRVDGDPSKSDYPTPYEVAMCGREFSVDGTMWAGKQAMLGASWDGVRRLRSKG